jgi:uncharacterized coiled-coil protein SlyX
VHVRGFKLVLIASCLAVAAAAWLTAISRPERVMVSAIAVAAALTLLLVARSSSADSDFQPDTEVEPVSAALEPEPDMKVEPHPEMEPRESTRRHRLSTRGARRLLELEAHLESLGDQLSVQEQTMAELAETLRRIEVESSEGLARLEQRLDGLEAENVEQSAAIHGAHEMHRRHVDRFQHALATHKEGLAALAQTLETASSPAAEVVFSNRHSPSA